MKFRQCFVLFLLAGLSLSILAGCKAEEEKVIENTIASLNGMADELQKIKSPQDITEAKPRLEKAAARMQDAMKDMASTASKTDTDAMAQKYAHKLSDAQKRLRDEMTRIGNEMGMAGTGPLEKIMGK